MAKIDAICKSHPWLRFSLDTREVRPQLWIDLGEAQSKCGHLAGVPLSVDVARNLHEIYLAKGVHATSAIEGNTLPEEKVLEIIRAHKDVSAAASYEEREVLNIIGATNQILDIVEVDGPKPITEADFKLYNRQILDELPVEEHVTPGSYSPVQVGVPGYRGVPPNMFSPLIQKLCDWLNGSDFKAERENAIVYGLIKAVVAHVYIVWIHPFGDGNGRTARLVEARILLEAGVPSAACHLLSDHYNKTRSEYYKELSNASKNGGNLISFIGYAIGGFIDGIRQQILQVKNQQWSVSWINYIHQQYQGKISKTEKRQRDLVLAMTRAGGSYAMDEIRRVTPEIAEEYAGLTSRTIRRDIEALLENGLLIEVDRRYIPNIEIIIQFLPRARKGDIAEQVKEAVAALPKPLSMEEVIQADLFE